MSECRRFTTHVHPLVSGEVDGALALKLGLHAGGCPSCDALLGSARRVGERLDAAGEVAVEPPADLVQRVMRALPDDAGRWRYVGAGLAAALAVGVGLAVALLIAGAAGFSFGPPLVELRSAMASIAGRLQQFGALLQALAGSLPRFPSPAGGGGGGSMVLPGLALVTTGLLGALATVTLSAVRGFGRRA